jgi:hypothetical protein
VRASSSTYRDERSPTNDRSTVYKRPNGKWAAQVYDRVTRSMRQVGTFATRRDARRAESAAIGRPIEGDAVWIASSAVRRGEIQNYSAPNLESALIAGVPVMDVWDAHVQNDHALAGKYNVEDQVANTKDCAAEEEELG